MVISIYINQTMQVITLGEKSTGIQGPEGFNIPQPIELQFESYRFGASQIKKLTNKASIKQNKHYTKKYHTRENKC